uniref:Uncharacterized protein n=1 Tax=Timema poppense TaxID=170557 RepID=A0A7R9D960_TIMPO|nr:unnamed protein product [Timema poppensis]
MAAPDIVHASLKGSTFAFSMIMSLNLRQAFRRISTSFTQYSSSSRCDGNMHLADDGATWHNGGFTDGWTTLGTQLCFSLLHTIRDNPVVLANSMGRDHTKYLRAYGGLEGSYDHDGKLGGDYLLSRYFREVKYVWPPIVVSPPEGAFPYPLVFSLEREDEDSLVLTLWSTNTAPTLQKSTFLLPSSQNSHCRLYSNNNKTLPLDYPSDPGYTSKMIPRDHISRPDAADLALTMLPQLGQVLAHENES